LSRTNQPVLSNFFRRSIYVSTYTAGNWSTPVKIQGAPENHTDAWQVFVNERGKYLYWSGTRTRGTCLFRSRRLADGSYGEETIIAQTNTSSPSPGDVIAAGEMSITGDGRFLYFVYMQYNSASDLELGIAVARKRYCLLHSYPLCFRASILLPFLLII